ATDGSDEETLTLGQTSPGTGSFFGLLPTSGDPAAPEDQVLQVAHGQTITAMYHDLDDGTGDLVTAADTATVDCQAPMIFNLEVERASSSGAVITFETDEPATVCVRCGPACGGSYPIVGQGLAVATSHRVQLTGLTSQKKYYFVVDGSDDLGHESTDDNAGQCYSLTTGTPPTGGLHVPQEYPTIQAAIDDACEGDVIWVADGVYTAEGNRDIDFGGKAITVRNETGPVYCVIDCENSGRGFYFRSGEGEDSVLDGFTITNGRTDDFLYGGGIACMSDSGPTIRNCIITGNSAVSGGGGICGGDAVIKDCIIRNNSASSGGGIWSGLGTRIVNCIIADNSGGDGGGICCWQDCDAVIENCVIKDNSGGRGGGISAVISDPIIRNCIISGNHASRAGGIYTNSSALIMTNCTVTGNYTDGSASGAWFRTNEIVTVTNCIFWNNYPQEIYEWKVGDLELRVSYSDIEEDWPGQGNIEADPLFVDRRNENYGVLWGSPCIDAGTNAPAGGLPATDIEGTARPLDGDSDGSLIVDMGAYEYRYYVPAQMIEVVPDRILITAICGGPNPQDQILSIRNRGEGALVWEITESCPWLTLGPSGGESSGEPNEVVLSVDIAGLSCGDHSCVLTISAEGAANSPRTVNVNLHVQGPALDISPNHFAFVTSKESGAPVDQVMCIGNAGGGTVDWQIDLPHDCSWLRVDPLAGQCTSEVNEVILNVDVNGLDYGSHSCRVTVNASGTDNSPQTVQVELTLLRPHLAAEPNAFEFWACGEVPNPPAQILAIRNTGVDTLNWQIALSEGCDWLQVQPLSGQSTGAEDISQIMLSVDVTGLGYGSHTCELTISDANADDSPQTVRVNLEVVRPVISVEPSDLGFRVSTESPNSASQILTIRNSACGRLNWQIEHSCPWLTVVPIAGTSTGEACQVTVSVDAGGMARGTYDCIVRVLDPQAENGYLIVPVNLIVNRVLRVPTVGYPTIQAAIDAAEDRDVVVVADGTYTGPGNRDLDFEGKAITVRSENGPENCIIDCQGTPGEPHQAFYFHSGESADSVVEGFTITNGYSRFGGAIANEDSSP
ncbi:MAG: BACON domain-containing protein, partial [Planctomycetota bacterium]